MIPKPVGDPSLRDALRGLAQNAVPWCRKRLFTLEYRVEEAMND
jgi:hypothetical protein